jgi:2-amino-4-hydroxy-6-hydroxymethyldihydropteridine diphosphokinase
MAQVYVSLGSNIEPQQHIRAGLADMRQHYGTLTLSSIYESEAVGFEGKNFYNLVARFETFEEVYTVANTLRRIEKNNGRIRTANRFSARTLDLDVLLYDDLILKEGQIEIPRDEILKYAFVLLPLAEIAPDAQHPVTQQTYADLWQNFDKKGQSLWPVELPL